MQMQPKKHARLTVSALRIMAARAVGAAASSHRFEITAAVVVAWFFLLRPEEVCADGKPGKRRSLRRSGVCFARRVGRVDSYAWFECEPSRAEVVLLFLEGRKTDRTGYSTILPRWRSERDLCPVRALSDYVDAVGDRLAQDGPLFPRATRKAFSRFIRDELALSGICDGGDRSPRRGGAAHLRVHLQDDSRRKLCSAGGWTAKTSTAEEYAGLTIEATRHWSRLMVRPVTLL